jgi:L-lysine exporter family protein LysE/ArgO
MITAFLYGAILALGLILPLGLQNVFVFTEGVTQLNILQALPVAVVASLSDSLLILLAVFGVSVAVLTLPWVKLVLLVAGVVFLGYVGWITWHNDGEIQEKSDNSALKLSLRRKVLFTLSVSLLNPHAILDTIGIIGTASLSYTGVAKIYFTIGCIFVSWIWFFMLIILGRMVGKLGHNLKIFNRISAVIMLLSAIYLLYQLDPFAN